MTVAVPSLIRVSRALFFFGLCHYQLGFNTIIGVITIVPIRHVGPSLKNTVTRPYPVLVADILLSADVLATPFRWSLS
jgi:hypothetical protein